MYLNWAQMDLVNKFGWNSLELAPKYIFLSVLKNVMHSFLVVNPWCQKLNLLKVGCYSSSQSTIYQLQKPVHNW